MATRTPIERRIADRVPVGRFQPELSGKANVLYVAFELDASDVERLENVVLERYQAAYVSTIGQEITRLGCTANANRPRAAELNGMRQLIKRDVASITKTFNGWLKRQAQALVNEHPSWSKTQYQQYLEAAQSSFLAGKNQQIINASRGNASEYARKLFYEKNNLTAGLFIWDASPPIVANSHKECIRRVRQGAVTWEVAQNWERTSPNCRHTRKRIIGLAGINCETIWRG